MTIYVRSTDSPLTKDTNITNDSGRLSDEIKFVKFSSISWTPDSKGFFYQVGSLNLYGVVYCSAYSFLLQRYPDNSVTRQENGTIATGGDLDATVYYHTLGTSQGFLLFLFILHIVLKRLL